MTIKTPFKTPLRLIHRLTEQRIFTVSFFRFFRQQFLWNSAYLTAFRFKIRTSIRYVVVFTERSMATAAEFPSLPNIVAYSEERLMFQRRLSACLFVNTITSERVNIGWWSLGVDALHKNLGHVQIWGVIAQSLGPHPKKCGVGYDVGRLSSFPFILVSFLAFFAPLQRHWFTPTRTFQA